jgi:hypothetical protein
MNGGKHPQMCVWGGGYNHFPDLEFILRTRKWKYPLEVVLIYNPEEGPILVMRVDENQN